LAACKASAEENNLAFLEQLESEWKWLFHELQASRGYDTPIQAQALHFIRQVVVTHMDCQSLNILKDMTAAKDDKTIRLIDFEYAGWNPRAADIANTFCEYCDMNNLCADYEREYPSRSQQNDYLLSYVRHADSNLAAQLTQIQQWEPFLATLRAEVGRFSALSHLAWSIWSVVKSRESSNIDFEYMVYARHRMDGYQFAKQQFFNKK
jgi:thiamine kinase-like enzyme